MLDAFELAQVTRVIRHEMGDMFAAATQSPGSYHYLCDVDGVVMFTHQPIGHILREYG